MDEVITFDKSLQERYDEYKEVLSGYEILHPSQIQKEWSFYLELVLDPHGWQALWKIQRKTCELLNLSYPTIVLVVVLNVDLTNLTALVKVLLVQDDIHIPERHNVPLINLFPTKIQDHSVALNIKQTANSLDMLRFFYLHLFMPWDYDDDESIDWLSKHLQSRLRLYYDMKNGVIPRPTAEHIHSLLNEAKHLQIKRETLENQLSDIEESDDNRQVDELLQVQIRMLQIKNEIDILEDSILRKVIIKRMNEEIEERNSINGKNERNIWMIFLEGKIDEYIHFLDKIKPQFPNDIVRFVPNLQATLETGNFNDVYILNQSVHVIKATGALETGGILKGISTCDKTILETTTEDVMLDFRGDVVLENLTINATTAQFAMIVRNGCLTIRKCCLIGDGKSSIHQGIIVLSGAKLELIECEVLNFSTGIVGNSGADIFIKSSDIHDVNYGLKIYDNCTVKILNTSIRNCKEYGVCVETHKSYDDAKSGTFEALNIIPQVDIELIKGNNNKKGDAVIQNRPILKAIRDLFDDPNFDMSICQSDDDMGDGAGDVTVIENGRYSPATI